MWWNLLIGPVSQIVGDVMKRVLPPEKMSEAERASLEAAITSELVKADMARFDKEVEDRVSARLLAEKELEKGNAFTNILAAVHRPVWSFSVLGLFAWTLLAEPLGFPAVPLDDVHKSIMQTVVIFYFGGRSVEKIFATLAARPQA